MAMIKASQVTPRQFRNVVPEMYRNMPYTKLDKADVEIEITSIVFSIYQAKTRDKDDKDDIVELVTRDGKPITNITVYIGLSNGCYSSVNGDTAIEQLASIVDFNETAIGQYPYELETPEKAKTIMVNEKMGKKEYPKVAFDPVE